MFACSTCYTAPNDCCAIASLRRVVEGCPLIDDMDRQIFQRRFANDLQSAMRNMAMINGRSPGRQFDLLPVRRFKHRALNVTGD